MVGNYKNKEEMKSKELKNYIEKYNIEWRYQDNEGTEDVMIFPHWFQIEQFGQLFSPDCFDEEGHECIMKSGYFSIWMKDICDYYGIELSEVFEKIT